MKKERKLKMANVGQIWPDILLPFTIDYSAKLTASELSGRTKIPRRTVSRTLNKLVKQNLIRYVISGKNKNFYLDLDDEKTKVLIGLIENYKSFKFSIENKAFLLFEDILKSRSVVIFGSYAKGKFTEASDIDLLVFGSKSKRIRDFAVYSSIPISIHFSTMGQFEKLLKKKNALAVEIVRNHIIFGSSDFINLCWRYYRNEL